MLDEQETEPQTEPQTVEAQALEEHPVPKAPVSVDVLNIRLNLVYRELKKYLQLRTETKALADLAEAFQGEDV